MRMKKSLKKGVYNMKRVTTALKILFRGIALALGMIILGAVIFRFDEMVIIFKDFYLKFSKEQAIWLLIIGVTIGIYIHSYYVRHRKIKAAKKRKKLAEQQAAERKKKQMQEQEGKEQAARNEENK